MKRKRFCVLVHFEHLEDVVRWCQQHFRAFRQDHRLKHVNRLGDVRHVNPIAMPMEYVKMQPSHQRVPERVLLI
ncbi:hypothetical protein D3C76_1450200 [compost metagenome]